MSRGAGRKKYDPEPVFAVVLIVHNAATPYIALLFLVVWIKLQ